MKVVRSGFKVHRFSKQPDPAPVRIKERRIAVKINEYLSVVVLSRQRRQMIRWNPRRAYHDVRRLVSFDRTGQICRISDRLDNDTQPKRTQIFLILESRYAQAYVGNPAGRCKILVDDQKFRVFGIHENV